MRGLRWAARVDVQLRREATLPDAHKLELLRVQKQEAPLPTLFYRLTILVVHGRDFGADVEKYREQLADLRSMLDAQPNPYLVTGYLEHARL